MATTSSSTIWAAQRFFWLENGEFADSVDELRKADLLDSADPPAQNRYEYGIRSANEKSFLAFAKRVGSGRWKGAVTIDETGSLGGKIKSKGGVQIEPVAR